MINLIWIVIILLSIIYGIFTGRAEVVNKYILETPLNSLKLYANIAALLIFWSGILEIARVGGFLKFISKGLKVLLKPLFPKVDKDDPLFEFLSANLACNILGLGNAATPFGLKAMDRLKIINHDSSKASKEMVTLVLLNTSGITLIPSTILALRTAYNSTNPSLVLPYIVICSFISTFFALFINMLYQRFAKNA